LIGWSIGFREFSRRRQPLGEESRIVGEGDAEFGFDLTEGFDFVGDEVVGLERGVFWFDFSATFWVGFAWWQDRLNPLADPVTIIGE
jgi:hypothetical protein